MFILIVVFNCIFWLKLKKNNCKMETKKKYVEKYLKNIK